MKSKDDFGDRMKGYENAFRSSLPRRMPVIIRLDGKAFHTYTKGMVRPFDEDLSEVFWETCKYLCKNIQGCKVAYHQSDEITLLLTNYDRLGTESWFDNNIQKMVSISASMATAKFNQLIKERYPDKGLAMFDSRVWVLPKEEVTNAFLWRQQDAIKNSVSMVASSEFPHKELHKLSGEMKKDKLLKERGIDWDRLPNWQKKGVCVIRVEQNDDRGVRSKWVVDLNIPKFSDNRDYIDRFVYVD